MKQQFKQFMKEESGATAIEYGLIAGLIAVVIIASLTSLGKALNVRFSNISDALS